MSLESVILYKLPNCYLLPFTPESTLTKVVEKEQQYIFLLLDPEILNQGTTLMTYRTAIGLKPQDLDLPSGGSGGPQSTKT